MSPVLQIEQLSKHFAGRPVLSGLDLQLDSGEVLAITGPSGSGKTTLLNLIAGLEQADSGEILLAGRSTHLLDGDQRCRFRRRHIGFVFQFFNLIPTLTVLENCLLPLELNGLEGQAERVVEQLAAIGLAGKRALFPEQLSGGEQQRAAIVRALSHRPSLILADEPTGNLDPATAADVGRLLLAHCRENGGALLMVTHSETLAEQADRRCDIGSLQVR